MPLRHIEQVGVGYYLMLLDENGVERPEDGQQLSVAIKRAAEDKVTDVFVISHGWMGDIPAAISQYDRWITAMANQNNDRALAHNKDSDFKALIVGVHWPSLPWGEERTESAVLDADDDELAAERKMDADKLVDRYAKRIADTPAARQALDTIVAAADDKSVAEQIQAGSIPEELEAAYTKLFSEAGLAAGDVAAAPGSDQSTFSPAATAAEWITALTQNGTTPPPNPGILFGGGLLAKVRDIVLAPVRQVSFWAMKNRARTIGERDVHQLIDELQRAAPNARFHLMGHSFGCIVTSAAVAGPISDGVPTNPLPRPVDSLFLVQGAMSLWSFADEIPFDPFEPGYFHAVCATPRAVRGPLVATHSSHDRAVGAFYPVGAYFTGDPTLDVGDLPKYGGTGTFGVHGTQPSSPLKIGSTNAQYGFEFGGTYNVDASTIICRGRGASGAHSDITHDEVAHILWQAATATM